MPRSSPASAAEGNCGTIQDSKKEAHKGLDDLSWYHSFCSAVLYFQTQFSTEPFLNVLTATIPKFWLFAKMITEYSTHVNAWLGLERELLKNRGEYGKGDGEKRKQYGADRDVPFGAKSAARKNAPNSMAGKETSPSLRPADVSQRYQYYYLPKSAPRAENQVPTALDGLLARRAGEHDLQDPEWFKIPGLTQHLRHGAFLKKWTLGRKAASTELSTPGERDKPSAPDERDIPPNERDKQKRVEEDRDGRPELRGGEEELYTGGCWKSLDERLRYLGNGFRQNDKYDNKKAQLGDKIPDGERDSDLKEFYLSVDLLTAPPSGSREPLKIKTAALGIQEVKLGLNNAGLSSNQIHRGVSATKLVEAIRVSPARTLQFQIGTQPPPQPPWRRLAAARFTQVMLASR